VKIGAIDHPKLYDLAARLDVNRPAAIGYLQLLWYFTAQHAVQGNVGKWTDAAIAKACDWEGDPVKFIGAMVAAHWIDADPTHRLLIHDWADHAEQWVKLKLQKNKLEFARPTAIATAMPIAMPIAVATPEVTAEATADTIAEASSLQDKTRPYQDKTEIPPIPPESGKRRKAISVDQIEFPSSLDTAEVRASMAEWLEHHRAIGKPYKSVSAVEKLFDQFKETPAAFVEAVNFSIGNNYQGLIVPGANSNGNRRSEVINGPGQRYTLAAPGSDGKARF
jgi:hypothetical protein